MHTFNEGSMFNEIYQRLQRGVDRLETLLDDTLPTEQQADILMAQADFLLGMLLIERLEENKVTALDCGSF